MGKPKPAAESPLASGEAPAAAPDPAEVWEGSRPVPEGELSGEPAAKTPKAPAPVAAPKGTPAGTPAAGPLAMPRETLDRVDEIERELAALGEPYAERDGLIKQRDALKKEIEGRAAEDHKKVSGLEHAIRVAQEKGGEILDRRIALEREAGRLKKAATAAAA